jgi:hypothetical protein
VLTEQSAYCFAKRGVNSAGGHATCMVRGLTVILIAHHRIIQKLL